MKKTNELKTLLPHLGYCFATNLVIEKRKVGYMYREQSEDENDSGWRFFAGTEDQDYVDNPNNTKIYDVNTIANYDPSIIPYLISEIGHVLKRGNNDSFMQVEE